MGVGELVILDVLLHLSPSFTSLFKCCGCVSVFFLVFPSAFLKDVSKNVSSYFVQLLKSHLEITSAACSCLQEIRFFILNLSSPVFWRFLTFSLSFAELSAGLGGGSRGRSHLQRDTEEGSDSAGRQQGSKMARGEWAGLMSHSVTESQLTKLFQRRVELQNPQ